MLSEKCCGKKGRVQEIRSQGRGWTVKVSYKMVRMDHIEEVRFV